MYLLFGIFIGALYGRNARAVNQRTYEDIQKAWQAFTKTHLAFTLYMVADAVYERLSRREVIYSHDLLCTCNRRSCPGYTPSIATYTRKMKAAA